MKKNFCDALKRLRGCDSQAVIALKLGVKQASYSRWESGLREPSFEDIEKILFHFGITPNELFGYDIVEKKGLDNKFALINNAKPDSEVANLTKENAMLKAEIERLHNTIRDICVASHANTSSNTSIG